MSFGLRCLGVLKSSAVRNALGTVLAAFGVEFGLGIDDTTATLLISVTVSALLNKFIDKKIQPAADLTKTT